MASTITLNFNSTVPDNYSLSFQYRHNGSSLNISETFKTARTASFQVTNDVDYIQNYVDAVLSDYPSLFSIDVNGSEVVITALLNDATFRQTENEFDFVSFQIFNEGDDTLLVSGIDGDRYLINNEVWIDINSELDPIYYKITFENLTNQKNSKPLIVYPNANANAKVNLAPVVKSLFSDPQYNDNYIIGDQIIPNSNSIRISVSYKLEGAEEEIGYQTTKTFIRGGKRTNDTNQTLISGAILRPSELLPVWTGYEAAEYYLDINNLVRKRLIGQVAATDVDNRRSKGCNELYFTFLNQMGGYSNWLFDSHTEQSSNSNLGAFVKDNEINDLGNTADFKLQVYAKVPKQYIGLIEDLIISPEIYVLLDGANVRVTSGRNNTKVNNIDRSYTVNLNFEFQYRINPSLLWSN